MVHLLILWMFYTYDIISLKFPISKLAHLDPFHHQHLPPQANLLTQLLTDKWFKYFFHMTWHNDKKVRLNFTAVHSHLTTELSKTWKCNKIAFWTLSVYSIFYFSYRQPLLNKLKYLRHLLVKRKYVMYVPS